MNNKTTSIYFLVFALIYPVYILVLVRHGIDMTNTIITIGLFLTSGYFYLKSRKEQ